MFGKRCVRTLHGGAVALTVIGVVCVSSVGAGEAIMALHVAEPVVSWGDSELTERLLDRLSGANGLEVRLVSADTWRAAESGEGFFSVGFVSEYGLETGARYVVEIANVRTDLEVRKGLSIPLVLSRYSAEGVISGTLRIVDSERGRLIHQEDFEITKRSRSDWQVFENNPHHGKLQTPASEKPALLEALEWRAADRLANTILQKLKLR
ncbi:MAG TPA: hypothetical protein VLB27_10395 [candidate division Zixibacteria bacterium]|nr:hypothetical protein [candidate division Zixibacteria bacterium]